MSMAKATDKSNTATIYLPPGFRLLTDVVAVQDPDTIRDQLASGAQQAFGLSVSTGKLVVTLLEVWRSQAALDVFADGTWTAERARGSPYRFHDPNPEELVVVVPDKPTASAGDTKPAATATPKQLGPEESARPSLQRPSETTRPDKG